MLLEHTNYVVEIALLVLAIGLTPHMSFNETLYPITVIKATTPTVLTIRVKLYVV